MEASIGLFLGTIGALRLLSSRKRKVCVILCDNGKAWAPRTFLDMFRDLVRVCVCHSSTIIVLYTIILKH